MAINLVIANGNCLQLPIRDRGLREENNLFFLGGWYLAQAPDHTTTPFFFEYGDGNTNPRIRSIWDITGSGKIMGSMGWTGGTPYQEKGATGQGQAAVRDLGWRYYAMRIREDRTFDFFIGAAAQNQTSVSGTPPGGPLTTVGRWLTIGGRATTANTKTNFLGGKLSNWVYYNGSIPTDSQIQQLANGAHPLGVAGLTPNAVWTFDGDANADVGGSQYDLLTFGTSPVTYTSDDPPLTLPRSKQIVTWW
mgnify:CR=1